MHTCIHAYMHTCIHAYTHTHTHTPTYIHIYIPKHTHTHTYIYTYVYIYTHTHLVCADVCIYKCVRTYIDPRAQGDHGPVHKIFGVAAVLRKPSATAAAAVRTAATGHVTRGQRCCTASDRAGLGGTCSLVFNAYPRAPSIQIVPTLGSKVYKYYLLWAFWSPRVMVGRSQKAGRASVRQYWDFPPSRGAPGCACRRRSMLFG